MATAISPIFFCVSWKSASVSEHAPPARALYGLQHGAAREAQARRADGGAEAVERAHGDLEVLPRLAQQRVVIDAAIGQAHGAQRVRAMTGMRSLASSPGVRASTMKAEMPRARPRRCARRPRSGRPGRRWRSRSWCRPGASRHRAGAWRWCSSPPRRSRHRPGEREGRDDAPSANAGSRRCAAPRCRTA